MGDATVSIDVVTNFDTTSFQEVNEYIKKTRDDIGAISRSLKDSMTGMEAPALLLSEQLDKCLTTADQVSEQVKASEKIRSLSTASEDDKRQQALKLQSALDDLKTMRSMLTGQDFEGSFSVDLAKQMFAGLPKAIQQQVNSITPQLSGMLRRMFSSINAGVPDMGSSINSTVEKALRNPNIQALLNRTDATAEQKTKILQTMIPAIRPLQFFKEYQLERFGYIPQKRRTEGSVEDWLPRLYKGSYKNKGYMFNKVDGRTSLGKRVLSVEAMDQLEAMIMKNNVVAKAAENSGIAKRDENGRLVLGGNISYNSLGRLSEEMWNQYYRRTGGLVNKVDYFGDHADSEAEKKEIQQRIIQRSLNGTGSSTMLGMKMLSDLFNGDFFVQKSEDTARDRLISNEAKRLKEQYVVEKISPFMKDATKKVTVGESQMTRMLGLQGHDYEDTDKIKIVSLAGYDERVPEHVKYLSDLKQNGLTHDGHRYMFHTIHGTGKDAVVRMIREDAAERIRAQYRPLAQRLGLAGDDVLNAFVPRDYEFEDAQGVGKHIDQLNKMWTDTVLAGSDLQNKRFAIVDFSNEQGKHSDGLGYVTRGLIPNASQVRMALSGKGSLVSLDYDTIGEWAEAAGLLDSQGRYMVKGIDGQEYDASKYHALIDKSVIKNLLAYQGMNSEQANTAFTGLMREMPIGVVADYSFDDQASGLGSQMTSFMAMSPELMLHQARALTRRMQELETLEGMRKYVFNDPEHDYLSNLAQDAKLGDENVLSSNEFKKRVDIYRDSLLRAASAGEFINFGDIADIRNERILRNPLLAHVLTKGGLSQQQVDYYKTILSEAHGRDFSDEEVRDLIELRNGAVDFQHIDADKVAAFRSPTGFGQFVVRQNYAKLLKPVYDQLGMSTTGIHLNNEDMNTLAGADMDADMAKVIMQKKNDDGINIVDELDKYQEYIQKLEAEAEKKGLKKTDLPPVKGKNTIDNIENWLRTAGSSVVAPLRMGFMSGVGSRLTQLGNMPDIARYIATVSMMANEGYDAATTGVKKPNEVEYDSDLFKALGLGQEFQKIPAHLEDMYNVKAHTDKVTKKTYYTTLDDKTLINPQNVMQTSGGRYINLEHLTGEDGTLLDRTNLPSVFSDAAVSGRIAAQTLMKHGYSDETITQDLLEAMGVVGDNGVGYNGAGEATRRLMKNKRAILAQFAGLTRTQITDEEVDILASQYAAAIQEITQDADRKQKAGGKLGFVKLEDGSYIARDDYIKQQKKKFGLNTLETTLGIYDGLGKDLVNFGFTAANLKGRFGDKTGLIFENAEGTQLPDQTYAKVAPAFRTYAKSFTIRSKEARFVPEELMEESPEIQPAETYQTNTRNKNKRHKRSSKRGNIVVPPTSQEPVDYEQFADAFIKGNVHMINEVLSSETSRTAAMGLKDDMDKLRRSFLKDIFSDHERTEADKWFGINYGQLNRLHTMLEYSSTHGNASVFGADSELGHALYEFDNTLHSDYLGARDAYLKKTTEDRLKRFSKMVEGRGDKADQQRDMIDAWDKEIKEQESLYSNAVKNYEEIQDPTEAGKQSQEDRLSELQNSIQEMKAKRAKAVNRLMDENVSMFENINHGFDELINGKDTSLKTKIDAKTQETQNQVSDALALLESFKKHGLISEEDYNRLKGEQERYFSDVQNGALANTAITERRKQLGMQTQSPEERAQEWLKNRLEVINTEKQNIEESLRTTEDAHKAYLDYKNNIGTPEALQYKQAYEEALGKVFGRENGMSDEQKQQRLAELQEEGNLYAIQASQLNKLLQDQQDNAYDDFVRSAKGQKLSREDHISRRISDLKASVLQKRGMDVSSAEYKKWDALFNDKEFWDSAEGHLNQQYDEQEAHRRLRTEQLLLRSQQLQRNRYGTGRGIVARALNYRDQQISQFTSQKAQIDNQLQYETDPEKIEPLKKASSEASDSLDQLKGSGGAAMAVMSQFGDVIGRVVTRLGRQLFQKALAETKRFVKEFDASMNEIQAITLKSDNEMQAVRSRTITKAIGLRTSVSNVATTEAALYRQGLSDQEVSRRTDAILKFATVTKLNVAEATKIITTALQNDLVQSAEQAMDALVALGDSAATTAAEIGKGMQKAAASAKVAGVSYAELTTLLTIGTSDTQLSGTQVGTALQTIFTRMRRLSLSGYTADVNGEKTTSSDAEAALKAVGIDLWDNKTTGKMRSAYEVLRDLSKVWQNLSDAQKSIVTNAMAGTRQTNIFSTLMEGMSEDGGATLDKYMGLVENSAGITQTKYEIAMESLAASMNTFKSSFDAIVESWTNNGVITGVLDGLSQFMQLIAQVGNTDSGQIGAVLGVVAGGITAIAVAVKLLESSSVALKAFSTVLSLLAGLAVGGAVFGVFGGLGSLFHQDTDEEKLNKQIAEYDERNNKRYEQRSSRYASKQSAIEEVKKLGKAYDEAAEAEKGVASDRLANALSNLIIAFPELSGKIKDAQNNLKDWKQTVDEASESTNKYTKTALSATVADIDEKFEETEQKRMELAVAKLSKRKPLTDFLKQAGGTYSRLMTSDVATAWNGIVDSGNVNAIMGTLNFGAFLQSLTEEDYGEDEGFAILDEVFTNEDSWLWSQIKSDKTQDEIIQLIEERNKLSNPELHYSDAESEYNSRVNTLSQAFASYIDNVFATQSANNKYNAIEEAVSSVDQYQNAFDMLAMMTSDEYDANFIKTALKDRLREKLDNEDNYNTYFDENGIVKENVVKNFLDGFFNEYINTGENVFTSGKWIKLTDYKYKIGKQGFNTLDNAIKYARENDISLNEITDKDGRRAYQTTSELVEAVRQQTQSEDKGRPLSELIYGITDEDNEINIRPMQNYTSLDELENAYDRVGLSSQLSNAITSDAAVFSAYLLAKQQPQGEGYETFKRAVEQAGKGKATNAAWIDTIVNLIKNGSITVADLRSKYKGAYQIFKSLVGAPADDILNELEESVDDSGEAGLSPELQKALDKANFTQRIKDEMQYREGYDKFSSYAVNLAYGTNEEKRSMTSSIRQEGTQYANYNAALNRYLEGKAKDDDFAKIASMSLYTETQLRNNYKSATMNSLLTTERDQIAEAQNAVVKNTIDAMILNSGMEYEQLFDENGNLTELAKPIEGLEDTYKAFQNAGYKLSQDGQVTFAGQEEKLTAAAIMQQYSDSFSTARQLWSNFIDDNGKVDEDTLTDLLNTDETFKMLYTAKVGDAQLLKYANLKRDNKQGTFEDMYGFLMKFIFGENWKDTSTWGEDAKTRYADIIKTMPEYQPIYDAMIAAMSGGADIDAFLKGENVDLTQAKSGFTQQILEDTLKKYKEKAEIAQSVATFTTGTLLEQDTLATDYTRQVKELQNAQYYLNQLTSGQDVNKSKTVLASYLGLTEQEVDERSADDLQKLITERMKSLIVEKLLPILGQAMGNIDLSGQDWKETLRDNYDQIPEEMQGLANLILGAVDDAQQIVLGAKNELTAGQIYRNTVAGFAEQSNSARGFAFLEDNWNQITSFPTQLSQMSQEEAIDFVRKQYPDLSTTEAIKKAKELSLKELSFADAFDMISKDSGVDWEKFMQENPGAAMMMELARAGFIGYNDFMDYLSTSFLGGEKTSAYYGTEASALFGKYYENGMFDTSEVGMNAILESYEGHLGSKGANSLALNEWTQKYTGWADIMKLIEDGEYEKAAKGLAEINAQMTDERVGDITKYTNTTNGLATIIGKIPKSSKDAAQAEMQWIQVNKKLQDQQTAITKASGKSGSQLDKQTKDILAGLFGPDMSADDVAEMTKDELGKRLDVFETAVNQEFTDNLQAILDQALSTHPQLNLDNVEIDTNGEISLDDFVAACQGTSAEVYAALLAMAGNYGSVRFITDKEGNIVSVKGVVNANPRGKYNSKGGGGGGGKSKADKLLEQQQRSGKINEHELKMIQYQESYYQGDSQLGNYGKALEEEQRVRERYQVRVRENLDELIKELKVTKQGSDDWYKLRDAILQAEEALEENSNAMDENRRKLLENHQAILKLRTDLEELVKQEIETRIQEERSMIQGAAQMEETISAAIRHRYQQEWDDIKKDIEKKREALEEEKRLIDERLNARKEAADAARDFETVAELEAQLAMISMDPTRTKDRIDLANKIADKRKEIAWRAAEDEATATKEGIDDQLEAYDKFVTDGDEALSKFLENANNFADEVTDILGKSHDELMQWLMDNDESYKNSLENTQTTIVQGWEDTFKQMYGIVDTYWDKINEILSNKDNFIEFMKQSTAFINASEAEREQMIYGWIKSYTDYEKAQDTSATPHHSDEQYDNMGGASTSTQTPSKKTPDSNSKNIFDTIKDAAKSAQNGVSSIINSAAGVISDIFSSISKLTPYAEGGLVQTTGPVWVDGTVSRPEAFLDADDTVMIRNLLDAFSHINTPYMTPYDSTNIGTTNNTIEEVKVVINEADLGGIGDVEEAARRLGEQFARQLEKQGFNTSNYNF